MEEAEESGKRFQKLRHRHSTVELDINRLEHYGLSKKLKGIKSYCAPGVLTSNLHKLGKRASEEVTKGSA
ncbi:MAG TPA: hypothetical protein ACFYD4_07450 [Candidatus Wunengus sp. YC61]|uniref:hypothetical protein n=1 Tax=Candidatus Wunengus sp. YC61 TaxID=3367698 RepID=UPI004026F14B